MYQFEGEISDEGIFLLLFLQKETVHINRISFVLTKILNYTILAAHCTLRTYAPLFLNIGLQSNIIERILVEW